MDAVDLLRVVRTLEAKQPIADQFEADSRTRPTWYRTQKQHMLGWISEYNGPGAYGRRRHDGDARAVWNHLRCVGALLWMAEALGEDAGVLRAAVDAVRVGGTNPSTQCGTFRQHVPWTRIEELIDARRPPRRSITRLRRMLA